VVWARIWESGSAGTVDDAVTYPVAPMLLTLTKTHDHLQIYVVRQRIIILPIPQNKLSHVRYLGF